MNIKTFRYIVYGLTTAIFIFLTAYQIKLELIKGFSYKIVALVIIAVVTLSIVWSLEIKNRKLEKSGHNK